MNKILVKNGDWDKARSELGTVLDAKKNAFNAQFEAAFGSNRKPAPVAAAPVAKAAPRTSAQLILSRKR